jgi:hypothetical protein
MESPLAQRDDESNRVSEVVPRFTTYFVSQVINLSDADGKIVIHLDIESASQREFDKSLNAGGALSFRFLATDCP